MKPKHFPKRAGALVLIFVFLFHCGPWTDVASCAIASLTAKEEQDIGKEFMLRARKYLKFVDDPSITQYVESMGKRLLSQGPPSPFRFRFYVVEEDVYNAFAAPGGHVVVYTGLIAAMESEDELAGIMAHEIAHVLNRHIAKRMEKAEKIGLMTMAGVLTGIFLGGSPAASGAITTGSVAAGQALSLKYSRDDERQADQLGIKYLTNAGYGGEGLIKILGKIRSKQWFGSEQIPSYLTTHPAVEERLAYLDTLLQSHPEWKRGARQTDLAGFEKYRAKIMALHGDPVAAHGAFDAALRNNPKDPVAHYGKALVLAREGSREAAVEHFREAVKLRPLDGDIIRELANVYFAMGSYDLALKALRGTLAFNPEDMEARYLLGRIQMEKGELKEALETFSELVSASPDNMTALYALGEAYGKTGNLGYAHYYLGRYYWEKGDRDNAVFHLNRAAKLVDPKSEKQREISEALNELKSPPERDHNEKNAS